MPTALIMRLNFDAVAQISRMSYIKFQGTKISDLYEEKIELRFPKLKTSAKSVQTSAEVSRKYYVLTTLSARTHRNNYVYLLKCLRVNAEASTRSC